MDEQNSEDVENIRHRAEKGDVESQFWLAVSYHMGKGIAKDCEQAVIWYRKAAEKNHTPAQFNLAMLFY